MKLHNILYAIGFLCLIIGVLGIDGWMYNETSLAAPVLLIVSAMVLWYFGMKEDGRIRKHN